MQNFDLLNLIKKKWKTVVSIALLIAVLAFALSVVQPLKYRTSVRLLVIQKYGAETDPFAASQGTEFLSNILSEVVYSSSFFDQVLRSGYNINEDNFKQNPVKRQKQWQKMIKSKVISDTGIIAIDIYNKDPEQGDQLAHAIAHILMVKGDLYHGGGSQVEVRMIDSPLTTNRPVKPAVLINAIVGLILGLAVGVGFVYLFPQYNFSFIRNKKKQKENLVSTPEASPDNIPYTAESQHSADNNLQHQSDPLESREIFSIRQ